MNFILLISFFNLMDTSLLNNIIKKFLLRYFFILNAAAQGWTIRYIGGDQFKFYKTKNKKIKSIKNFINQFRYELV